MSDTTTPNFGFTLPSVGASQDTWGAKLNANFTLLDTKLRGSNSTASPGWRIDVDGTIENWALITTNSAGVATWVFPRPFVTGIRHCSATPSLGSNIHYTAALGPFTTSSIQVYSMLNGAPTACGVWVRAVGF